MIFVGSAPSTEPPPIVSSIKQEGDHIEVYFAPESVGYFQTCTEDNIALFLNENEECRNLMLQHETLGKKYVGYHTDGEFGYPIFDKGCDVVYREPCGDQTSVA